MGKRSRVESPSRVAWYRRRTARVGSKPSGSMVVHVARGSLDHVRGIDAHRPVDLPGGIRGGLQRGQDPRPDTGTLPAPEPPIQTLPGRVRLGHVPPGRPGPHPPPDPVDDLPFCPLGRPSTTRLRGQNRLQPRPLRVAEIVPPRCRYPGHEVSGRSRFAWSLTDLPETSSVIDHRHARLASLATTDPYETRPSRPGLRSAPLLGARRCRPRSMVGPSAGHHHWVATARCAPRSGSPRRDGLAGVRADRRRLILASTIAAGARSLRRT